MAKIFENQAKDYEEIRHTPSGADVSAGALVNTGDCYGFAIADIADGSEGVLVVRSENVKVAKNASLAITPGDALYYDSGDSNVNKTATDNTLVGFSKKSALAADTHVTMNFDGRAAFLKA